MTSANYADVDSAILHAFKTSGWSSTGSWVYYDAIVNRVRRYLQNYRSRRTIERRIRLLASSKIGWLEGNRKGYFRTRVRM